MSCFFFFIFPGCFASLICIFTWSCNLEKNAWDDFKGLSFRSSCSENKTEMLQNVLMWENPKPTVHYDHNSEEMHKHENPLQKLNRLRKYIPLSQHPVSQGKREGNLLPGLSLLRSPASLKGAEATAEQCAPEPRGSSDTLVERQPKACHEVPQQAPLPTYL